MLDKFKSPVFLVPFIFIALLFLHPFGSVSAQTSTADQVITLKSGFNFVSFTVAPPAKPSELILKNTNIEDIYLYSAAAGSFLSAGEGTLTSLAIGKGYIIKSKADTSITINGPPADAVGDITLKKGFNLLGFSKLSSSSTVNAFTRLMNSSSAIAGVYKWSPVTGSFIQVVRDYEGNITMLDGSDPALKPGEAYFVNVTEDTKINYDDGVKLTKFFAGLYTDPSSDAVAAGGTYDLNKVKVYAVYSDGSTIEVTTAAVFVPNIGRLSGKTYAAPKYATSVVFTVSYTDAASGVKREGYFTLTVTSSSGLPIKTTTYRCVYKLSSNTKVIDEESVVTSSVTAAQVVLSVADGSLAPKPGDVLIGYHGDGYLRKVTSVRVQNGQAFVATTGAALEEAFETLDYSYKGKLSTLQATNAAAPGSVEAAAVARFLSSKAVMPAPGPDRSIISKDNLKKIMDNVSISVSLTKAEVGFDPVIECDIEVGWFKLKKFLFVVGGELTAGLEFAVEAKAKADLPIKSEIEIFHSAPHFFSIGPVPFSFEWNINCGVDASVSVTGSYNFSGSWKYGVRIGAQYSSATKTWTKINQITKISSSENNYELKGGLEIKPYFNIGFATKLAAVAGPKVTLEAYFLFLARMLSMDKLDITVSAGVNAGVNFVVEVFSWTLAEFNAELFSFEWPIYAKTIDFFVAAPIITPAGGSFSENQKVEMTSLTQDASIRYTTDGSDPSPSNGILYLRPITVTQSMIIKAVAFKSDTKVSAVTRAVFEIDDVSFPMTPASDFAFSCSIHGAYTNNCDDLCSSYSAYYRPKTTKYPLAIKVPASCLIAGNSRSVTEARLGTFATIEAIKLSEGIKNVSIQGHGTLKKVVLPSSIQKIDISNCTALEEVVFSDGIKLINENAFQDCTALASIEFPSSVTAIGDYAFQYCSKLSAVRFPPYLRSIGRNAFMDTGLLSVTIPDSVTTIGTAAFNRTQSLEQVVLPRNLSVIPGYAFANSGLKNIDIPNGVTEIGDYAFAGCKRLVSATCGSGLRKIGQSAFYACDAMQSIYFTGGVPSFEGTIYLPGNIYFKAGTAGWTTPTWNGKNTYPY